VVVGCVSAAVGMPCAMMSTEMSSSSYGKQAHKYSNIWGGQWQAASEQHKHGFGDNDCNSSKKYGKSTINWQPVW